ncbi:MAG: universal stress protein [Candidatus Xenobia bacterium]
MLKFLIPLDGSPLAQAALRQAAGLAAHRSAELVLVHVVQEAYQGATLVAPYNDELKRKGRVCLESAQSLLDQAGFPVRTRMLTGEPGPALIQCAREENPDLIAMGTHGRGGIERLLLGSVTEHVLTCAPCPVLVTRQEEAELDLSAARVWQGYSRALVALDGSEPSHRSLGALSALMAENGQVTLLSALDLPIEHHTAWKVAESSQEGYLREQAATLARASLQVSCLVGQGSAARAIVQKAAEQKAEVILVGSRGRGAVATLFLGSVARDVARTSECAVLVIRGASGLVP